MDRTVVILAGSKSDEGHADRIKGFLYDNYKGNLTVNTHYLSAHKNTKKVLCVLEDYNLQRGVIFITVAGMSNALSGVVACNTHHVVIACPPFEDTAAYMIDIHSTLRMPSKVPFLTVISPENCALAVIRIMEFADAYEPARP